MKAARSENRGGHHVIYAKLRPAGMKDHRATAETWMLADKAVELGFAADEVSGDTREAKQDGEVAVNVIGRTLY